MRRVLRLGNGDGDANLQVNMGPGWSFIRYLQSSAGEIAARGSTLKLEAAGSIHGSGASTYNVYRMKP